MDEASGREREGPPGPERALAAALSNALRPGFPERAVTAQHLAELLLDAAECALGLANGADPAPAHAGLELLAARADVFGWDGPPGWDEVLERGLAQVRPLAPGASPLDGIGRGRDRAEQRGLLLEVARAGAVRLLQAGRAAAALAAPGSGELLVAAHAALLRSIGCAAAASTLQLPRDPGADAPGPPRAEALSAEMDARAAAGSDFGAAQEEWLSRLSASNPGAAHKAFRTFFAGLSQVPRAALAARRFRDEARAGRLPSDCEALLGAVGGFQPVRWASLRGGAAAAWIAALCPAPPAAETPLERLARECDTALDLAGRLWFAEGFGPATFTALASLFTARCASALALWEELWTAAPRDEAPRAP